MRVNLKWFMEKDNIFLHKSIFGSICGVKQNPCH